MGGVQKCSELGWHYDGSSGGQAVSNTVSNTAETSLCSESRAPFDDAPIPFFLSSHFQAVVAPSLFFSAFLLYWSSAVPAQPSFFQTPTISSHTFFRSCVLFIGVRSTEARCAVSPARTSTFAAQSLSYSLVEESSH
jgi:hypothetical protein